MAQPAADTHKQVAPGFAVLERGDEHALAFNGAWSIHAPVAPPSAEEIVRALRAHDARSVGCDCRALTDWDSLFVTVLRALRTACAQAEIALDIGAIPEGAQRLLALSETVTPHVRPERARPRLLDRLVTGAHLLEAWHELVEACTFTGEVLLALVQLLRGRARTRLVDFLWFVQQAGPQAIGIVTLISVLVGMILAYLGAVQLRAFGAQVYVGDLVGVGMVREMGALMTAVIMAGRTGAAYAAQLGTMQTREEIDAIETLGIPPIEFLVLPRMLALTLVMPLLCIYSDVLGIIGGAPVALLMDVTWTQYLNSVQEAVDLQLIGTGVYKSIAFGALIAASGCQAGMRCGRSSEAVGQATTKAVVNAIVLLVVADAAFNIVYHRLGI